jgi:hypothetical protein
VNIIENINSISPYSGDHLLVKCNVNETVNRSEQTGYETGSGMTPRPSMRNCLGRTGYFKKISNRTTGTNSLI